MDEESEPDEESSDDEFILNEEHEELDDIDEELNLSDIKPDLEEDTFCPWIEDPATIPKLELPDSSQDIPIPPHSTMDAMEIFEILRCYHRTLRLTPFCFEDFCAALCSFNNSCIMAEVHMALLKVCMKSDDEEQTQYSVTETNNSVNIMLHHMDTLTYGEIIRQYIEAFSIADSTVREAINVENYPYVGYEPKLVVLLFMTYRFLYSSEFKKVVNNVGRFVNDENCRVCGKSNGRIVGCTQCEAAFHVECSHLKPFPEVLVCNICKKNNVKGVLPQDESVEKEPLRAQPIGRDRYGRFYWFLCRRIIVQSLDESEVHYYSTPPQLYQLLQNLDRNYYERDLCEAIRLRIDEFLEQMTLTMEMTSERREATIEALVKKNFGNYEYAESVTKPIYLHKDSMRRMASILNDCSKKIVKIEPTEPEPEDDDATRSSGPLESEAPPTSVKFDEDTILPESMLGIFGGSLGNTFWSGGASHEDLIQHCLHPETPLDPKEYLRMGDEKNDETFMQYYNFYFRNDMAESFLARKKAADKKKYMATKFGAINEFEWVVARDRMFYGDSVLHNKFVGWTLNKICRKVPSELMHRKWLEVSKVFDFELSVADDYKKLAECLLRMDAAMRKTIFMQQWWSGLGQTKMERITSEQREVFQKEQQRNKKMEVDALAKDLDDSFIRVNYSIRKYPNTYILRQKGETYRNAGKGAMGGWAWVAKKYSEKWCPVPEKPLFPLTDFKLPANRKAKNLETVVSRIIEKRDSKKCDSNVSHFELTAKCYSPSCRKSLNPKCYSPMCRNGFQAESKLRHDDEEREKRGRIGLEKPWPIPEIQTFSTPKGGKSLFVLQRNSRVLRQMIFTAGRQQVYMPGFSSGIKSNLLIWPYPAPRPTLDLCWKWQTLNARSLHAVALQLKIMYSSIKWSEFEPEDSHPDRRVVIDTPSHDERRRIIRHKEMPPYGQYERYELEIEIIPLYDEQEEEDDSWLSRNRATDCSQRSSNHRKKRPQSSRNLDNRQATSIRREWVDGVTLKVYEIKDYWKWFRTETEKGARRRQEAMKKIAKTREDAERQRQMMLQRQNMPRLSAQGARLPPPPHSIPRAPHPSDRINVPYMGNRRTTAVGLPLTNGSSGGRYLEKYNNSPVPPRAPSQYPQHPSTSTSQSTPYRVQPNPMIRKLAPFSPYSQQARATAGSDQHNNGNTSNSYRAVLMTNSAGGGGGQVRQPLQQYPVHQQQVPRANGYNYQDPRNGTIQQGTAMPHRRVMKYQDSPSSSRPGPPNPAYEPNVPPGRNPTVRQVISSQLRSAVGTPGSGAPKGNVIYLKGADGGTQRMVIRTSGGAGGVGAQESYQPKYTPGTVLASGGGNGELRRMLNPNMPVGSQLREMYTPQSAQRFVRVPSTGTPRPAAEPSRTQVIFQRYDYPDQEGPSTSTAVPQQQQPYVPPPQPPAPQNPRFVIQGRGPPPPPKPRTAPAPAAAPPRGGITMQMMQQEADGGDYEEIVHEEVIYNPGEDMEEFQEDATGFAQQE